MPYKPNRSCSYYGCSKRAALGSAYCPEHKRLIDGQYDKYQRNYVHSKRYGRAWQRKRDAYIKSHPYCELCMESGVYAEATEVHHIKPLSDGGGNDKANLLSLCHSCHMSIHRGVGGAV